MGAQGIKSSHSDISNYTPTIVHALNVIQGHKLKLDFNSNRMQIRYRQLDMYVRIKYEIKSIQFPYISSVN